MKRILFLTVFFANTVAFGQAVSPCLTDTLVINTGYDPTTGLAITGSADGGTPITDPHWVVTAESPGVATAIVATAPYISGLIEVTPGSSADVVASLGSPWVSTPPGVAGGWISCLNSNTYYDCGCGTPYNMTLGRKFRMCSDDSITFTLYIADDNYISSSNIDGSIAFGYSESSASSYFASYTYYTQTVFLTAGTHTLNFEIVDYNTSVFGSNPTGLNLYGTVSSATHSNSLVAETNTVCATYSCAATVAACDVLTMPDSILLCNGGSQTVHAVLSGSDSILNMYWVPATGLSNDSILDPVITSGTSGWYDLTVNTIVGSNLVVNGDFSAGNFGFSSSYTYSAPPSSVLIEGDYSVYNNPFGVHTGFTTMGDHTTGTGNMLIVNGGATASAIWCETIPVTPNTNYDFSAWIADCSSITVGADVPIMQFMINGVLIGTPTSITAPPGTWVNFFSTWNSGTNTSATICIYDETTAVAGNDFAVDDISFRQLCTLKDSFYLQTMTGSHIVTTDTLCNLQTVSVNLTDTSTGTFSYIWSPATFLSSSTGALVTISPTVPGNYLYTVNVTPLPGTLGCGAIDTVNLHVVPNDFTLENPDTLICLGQHVQTRISGASPEFTWVWSPAAGVSNTTIPNPVITPTASTTYTVSFSYGSRCSGSHSFTINIDTPAIPITILDSICLGQTQDVNISFPGSTAFSFVWAPATYLSTTTGSTVTISPPASNDYLYFITISPAGNPPGCSVTDIVKLHVAPNDFILANNDTVICIGQYVQANVLVSSSSNFTWSWTPVTGVSAVNATSPQLTPTATTTYTVTGAFESHCSAAHSFTIVVDTPAIPEVIHDTICLGMTDNVNLTFPGSSTYDFIWTPGTYVSDSLNPISSLTPTVTGNFNYIISVKPKTNPGGCGIDDEVVLHVAPNDFSLLNDDTAICLGQSVQADVVGSSEFLYSWSPVQGVSITGIPDPVIAPTVTTTYTVTGSYAPHCPDMMHFFTIEVDTVAIPASFTDTICLGTADSFNLAFPNSNLYSFRWMPTLPALNAYLSDSQSSIVAVAPSATGTFEWTITVSPHALECSANDFVTLLVVPNSFTITPTTDTLCEGNPVHVIGNPYPLFSYQWNPTIGIPVSDVVDPIITADTSTIYVVTATYKKCPPMRDTLKLYVEPNPTVYISGSKVVCVNDTLHLGAQVEPGWYTDYSYSWSPSFAFDNNSAQYVTFSDSLTTEVEVTVTTEHGCKGSDSSKITIYPANFLLPLPDEALCPGDSVSQTVSGGVSYLWQPALFLSDTLGSTVAIHPLTSMTYSVIGTSVNGCKDTTTFNVTVHPSAVIYLPDSARLYPGQNYVLNPQTNCTSMSWFPTWGLDNALSSNPVASPGATTLYYVTGITSWNCATKDSILLVVDPQSVLAMPNAFTPGAGANGKFKVILNGIATLNYFRVYNRWGQLVFQANDINDGWDGSFNGEPQPFDVYIYTIEATTSTGTVFTRQGNVTLIR